MNYDILDNCVTATQFKTLFTAAERIAARALRNTDPQVDDMFDMLDDIRTTHVSLVLPDVIGMLEHLAAIGVLTDERVYQIKQAYIPGTDNPPQWPLIYPSDIQTELVITTAQEEIVIEDTVIDVVPSEEPILPTKQE